MNHTQPYYLIQLYVRVGLQFKDEKCLELCCQAWLCFVKKLVHVFNVLYSLLWSLLLWTICHLVVLMFRCSLDPGCLGVLLSQLVVMLSSLMDSYPKIVSEVLNYLIIEHRYMMKSVIIHLHLLVNKMYKILTLCGVVWSI